MINLALTTFAHIVMIGCTLWIVREIINIIIRGKK